MAGQEYERKDEDLDLTQSHIVLKPVEEKLEGVREEKAKTDQVVREMQERHAKTSAAA